MSLPPLNPDKSTAGIVLDPATLERVVPSSRRKDGTTRKELKIRPGFTPQEDVGRFRGTRQSAADARVGVVVGSNRPPPPKQPNPENPFAQPIAAKSKAQLKNEKRRAAKRANANEANKAWDEMDSSSDEGEEVEPTPAEEAYPPPGSGGAPVPLPTSPPARDPTAHLSVTDAALNNNAPPISPGDIAGPASSAYSSAKTEEAWKAASSRNSSPAPATSTRTSRPGAPKQTPSSDKGKGQKPHPIQGGRQGPLGLAHPPAPPKNTQAEFPSLGGGKKAAAQEKKAEEPRVRKEVKVREGGANDLSSLSARLRGMVIANASQETPRQRRHRVASGTGKEDDNTAAA